MLFEIAIVEHEDVKVFNRAPFENGLRFSSVHIRQVVYVHVVLLSAPHLVFSVVTQHVLILFCVDTHVFEVARAKDSVTLLELVVQVDEFENWVIGSHLTSDVFSNQSSSNYICVTLNTFNRCPSFSRFRDEDRGLIHKRIPEYFVIRYNFHYLVLSKQELIYFQVRWQVVLPDLQTKDINPILNVLKKATFEMLKLRRKSFNKLNHCQLIFFLVH